MVVVTEYRTPFGTHEVTAYIDDGAIVSADVIEYGQWVTYQANEMPQEMVKTIRRAICETTAN